MVRPKRKAGKETLLVKDFLSFFILFISHRAIHLQKQVLALWHLVHQKVRKALENHHGSKEASTNRGTSRHLVVADH
jgi:hypothetical protein